MADNADLASEITDRMVSERVGGVLNNVSTVADNTHCEECGDEIPAARRIAAPWATMCVSCKEAQEAVSAHYRRRR